MDKSNLRVRFKSRIGELSAQQKNEQSSQIVQKLQEYLRTQQGFWTLFSPLKDEPNLVELLGCCAHIQWVFPVVVSKTQMVFRRLHDKNQWVTSAWGLAEPARGDEVSPQSLQGAVIPGLAFDRQGRRLGRGGGFYDRFLVDFKGLKLGVTFQEALSMEALPSEPHDQTMNTIVSPNEWIDVNTSEVHYGIESN